MPDRKSFEFAFCTLLLACLLVLGCSRAPERDANSEAIIEIVKKSDMYAGRVQIECLRFMIEQQNERQTDIAMREKHGDGCPGDPTTSPVIDRFRIDNFSGTILRYDIASDGYEAVGTLPRR